MNKDPLFYLKHILESIERIERFTKNYSKTDFLNDELLQSAVVRQIEIIGEAVKNIPPSFTKKYPQIPWEEIAGTRDKMIHHYFGVDYDLIFDIILLKDIPQLKQEINNILKK